MMVKKKMALRKSMIQMLISGMLAAQAGKIQQAPVGSSQQVLPGRALQAQVGKILIGSSGMAGIATTNSTRTQKTGGDTTK